MTIIDGMDKKNNVDIKTLLSMQDAFFRTGITKSYEYRINALEKLSYEIENYQEEICKALYKDLRKSKFEAYMTEIAGVIEEINYHRKNLKRWIKDKRVQTSLAHFPSRSYIHSEPYGKCLIMAPWNYVFSLSFGPLIGAISGGNCAIIKPSAYTPNTSLVIKKIVERAFPPQYISVILGGRKENVELLDEKFDFIFFTGSVEVGKYVMEKASKNLTPVVLELGGKSPAIVEKTANIKLAAKRIAFGKILNAGQTCVAPDYVFVDKEVKIEFISEYIKCIQAFFPKKDFTNFPKIINKKHFDRILEAVDTEKIIYGGEIDIDENIIFPTLIEEDDLNSKLMTEEIFGPILPIIEFGDISESIEFINSRPKPLALYIFTKSKVVEKRFIEGCSYGGGCINDTIVHIANNKMGFGGVGDSGMGSYHGKLSYEAFTHKKSILKKSNLIDIPLRYHPYSGKKLKLIRKIIK